MFSGLGFILGPLVGAGLYAVSINAHSVFFLVAVVAVPHCNYETEGDCYDGRYILKTVLVYLADWYDRLLIAGSSRI